MTRSSLRPRSHGSDDRARERVVGRAEPLAAVVAGAAVDLQRHLDAPAEQPHHRRGDPPLVAKIFAKLTGLPSTSFTVRSLPAAPIGTLL
jgi:hypothetical protein